MEETTTLEIEVLAVGGVVRKEAIAYKEASPSEQCIIDGILAGLDIHDARSVLSFGTHAQEQLTVCIERMLEDVKAMDGDYTAQLMTELLIVMRGFELEGLSSSTSPRFFSQLLGRKAKPVVKFLSQYEDVNKQMNQICNTLEEHKNSLLADSFSLDRSCNASLENSHDLGNIVSAGSEQLSRLDGQEIPEMKQKADAGSILAVQELIDLRDRRDDLDYRVHDLHLSWQVVMQCMPGLSLVQKNNTMFVTKIISILTHTIPTWRQQLARTVSIYRSTSVVDGLASGLAKKAKNLSRQMERGSVDVGSLKEANDILVTAIEEGLQIAEQGVLDRQLALTQMKSAEDELRITLEKAKARSQEVAGGATVEINIEPKSCNHYPIT